MTHFSNTVIGILNLLTLMASVPLIGAALWLARSTTTCESFLQTPLLALGFAVLVISLAGFVGACFNVAWALWLYLSVMLLLIATLLSLTLFGFAVTAQGGGEPVPSRVYREYRLGDYSQWLRKRVEDPSNWLKIRACILNSNTCSNICLWTPLDYLQRDMSPIQSGCCKPPTACSYGSDDADCLRWNSAPVLLCYECNSCKAGVLEGIRQDWRKICVLNVVVIVFLVSIYCIGCCAYRNARRADTGYEYGENRMTKIRPRWDFYWWRWLRDKREELY